MAFEKDIEYIVNVFKPGVNNTEIDVVSLDAIVDFDTKACLQMTSLFTTTNLITSIYAGTWAGFFIESEVIFNLATFMEYSGENDQTNFSIIILNSGKFELISPCSEYLFEYN